MLDKRGFAGTGMSEDADPLSLPDIYADIADRRSIEWSPDAVGVRQVFNTYDRHSALRSPIAAAIASAQASVWSVS